MHLKITLLYNSDVLCSFCITTYYLQYNLLDDIIRAVLLTFTPPYFRRRYSVLSTQNRPCTLVVRIQFRHTV